MRKFIKPLATLIVVALITVQTISSAQAGWFEKSTITSVYARETAGGVGIVYKGTTFGLNLNLKRGYQYSIIACSGFALKCSYTTPVVISPESITP